MATAPFAVAILGDILAEAITQEAAKTFAGVRDKE